MITQEETTTAAAATGLKLKCRRLSGSVGGWGCSLRLASQASLTRGHLDSGWLVKGQSWEVLGGKGRQNIMMWAQADDQKNLGD